MNNNFFAIPIIVIIGILIFPFVAFYGNDILIITSTSMQPVLHPNDLIIVENIPIDQVSNGDIITFESHMEFGIVAHRVIEIHDEFDHISLSTKGDNIQHPDPWLVTENDFIGKVVHIIPDVGILLSGPVRFTLIIGIIIMSFVLLKDSFSKKESEK